MSSEPPALRLDWIGLADLRRALRAWYSRPEVPINPATLGVFEAGRLVGVIAYGRGATHTLVHRYGLEPTQGCELVRVAFAAEHHWPVSKALGISLRLLVREYPGLQMAVTFADPTHHHGGIYQATGWIYSGLTSVAPEYLHQGTQIHGRSYRALSVEQQAVCVRTMGTAKHRYLYPLCKAARDNLERFRLPYPSPRVRPVEPESTPPRAAD